MKSIHALVSTRTPARPTVLGPVQRLDLVVLGDVDLPAQSDQPLARGAAHVALDRLVDRLGRVVRRDERKQLLQEVVGDGDGRALGSDLSW